MTKETDQERQERIERGRRILEDIQKEMEAAGETWATRYDMEDTEIHPHRYQD